MIGQQKENSFLIGQIGKGNLLDNHIIPLPPNRTWDKITCCSLRADYNGNVQSTLKSKKVFTDWLVPLFIYEAAHK